MVLVRFQVSVLGEVYTYVPGKIPSVSAWQGLHRWSWYDSKCHCLARSTQMVLVRFRVSVLGEVYTDGPGKIPSVIAWRGLHRCSC